MAILVSVPCIDCNGPVYFGDEKCRRCGSPVSRDVRDVLDERLDATGGEFTTMRRRIRELSWLLVFLAGLYVFQVVILLLADFTPWILLEVAVIGGTMVFGAAIASRHPRTAVILVGGVWGGVQILAAAINPLSLAAGSLFKLVTLVALVRGYLAAMTADRIRRELAREADAAAKLEFQPP